MALVMLVVVILANGLPQNVVQPIALGATLALNPSWFVLVYPLLAMRITRADAPTAVVAATGEADEY